MYLMGAYLMGVLSYVRVPHGRASHGRVSHLRVFLARRQSDWLANQNDRNVVSGNMSDHSIYLRVSRVYIHEITRMAALSALCICTVLSNTLLSLYQGDISLLAFFLDNNLSIRCRDEAHFFRSTPLAKPPTLTRSNLQYRLAKWV